MQLSRTNLNLVKVNEPFDAHCCHLGTLTLRAERQNGWLSKITNDGLTRSGTGCFIAVPI